MNTRQMTQEVRLQQWAVVIQQQQASGLGINAWCEENSIKRSSYFYWLRKLREAACEQITETRQSGLAPPGFAQVKQWVGPAQPGSLAIASIGTLRVEVGEIHLTVDSTYPIGQLAALLQELGRVC